MNDYCYHKELKAHGANQKKQTPKETKQQLKPLPVLWLFTTSSWLPFSSVFSMFVYSNRHSCFHVCLSLSLSLTHIFSQSSILFHFMNQYINIVRKLSYISGIVKTLPHPPVTATILSNRDSVFFTNYKEKLLLENTKETFSKLFFFIHEKVWW